MRKKKKFRDRPASARIEASRDRLYRATDPVAIAKVFFPQKHSFHKRTAFVTIIFELRKARDQKLETLNHIPDKFKISPSSFCKARSIMTRVGLIKKTGKRWGFSSRFEKGVSRLIDNLDAIKAIPTAHEKGMESVFISAAKTEPVYYKLREKWDKEREPDGLEEFLEHIKEKTPNQ